MSIERKLELALSDFTPEILDKLAEDPDWRVRAAVAENPNTPIKTLKKLKDEDKDVMMKTYDSAIAAALRHIRKHGEYFLFSLFNTRFQRGINFLLFKSAEKLNHIGSPG